MYNFILYIFHNDLKHFITRSVKSYFKLLQLAFLTFARYFILIIKRFAVKFAVLTDRQHQSYVNMK